MAGNVVMDRWAAPLAFRMLHVLHGAEARLEEALAGADLSLAKFRVLSTLAADSEPVPLGSLAERCACVRSNMTQLVDRLEADGLVARVDDPKDRRMIRAELTAEGRARHDRGFVLLQQAERALLAGLSGEERDTLTRLLDRLGVE